MNMFRRVILAGAMLLLSTISQAATVVLSTNAESISVGDQVVIDVILEDAFAGEFSDDVLLAFGFNLSYNEDALAFTDASVGAGWDDDTSFFDFDLAGSAFPGFEDDGSDSSILLGQLTFTATEAGNFTLAIQGDSSDDPSLGLIYLGGVSDILAEITIAVQPVPLPAAGWLLMSALLGLARVRRWH